MIPGYNQNMLPEPRDEGDRTPVRCRVFRTDYCPPHWHPQLEILYVLEGAVDVRLGVELFRMEQDDVAVLNPGEIHILSAVRRPADLLSLQVEPAFLNVVFGDDGPEWIECLSPYFEKRWNGNLDTLRRSIALVVRESDGEERFDDIRALNLERLTGRLIEQLTEQCNLTSLLTSRRQALQPDRPKNPAPERHRRIFLHLMAHSRERVSLGELADREGISLPFLSTDIRETIGSSYQELLNSFRVADAMKELLSTEDRIVDVAYRTGFSDPKYLNKAFERFLSQSPSEFRKRFGEDAAAPAKVQRATDRPLESARDRLVSWLSPETGIPREASEDRRVVDVNGTRGVFRHIWREQIDAGNVREYLKQSTRESLEAIQKDIRFRGLRLTGFFTGAFLTGDAGETIPVWRREEVLSLLGFFRNLVERLVIVVPAGTTREIVDSFLSHALQEFGPDVVSRWIFELEAFPESLHREVSGRIRTLCPSVAVRESEEIVRPNHPLLDTVCQVPRLLEQALEDTGPLDVVQIADDEEPGDISGRPPEGIFRGRPGIYTRGGIVKPAYYGLFFLSHLGTTILSRGPDHILTREGDSVQALFFTPVGGLFDNPDDDGALDNLESRHIRLSLTGLPGRCRVTRFTQNRLSGSSFQHWVSMGSPPYLTLPDKRVLNDFTLPRIGFTIHAGGDWEGDVDLLAPAAELILFDPLPD